MASDNPVLGTGGGWRDERSPPVAVPAGDNGVAACDADGPQPTKANGSHPIRRGRAGESVATRVTAFSVSSIRTDQEAPGQTPTRRSAPAPLLSRVLGHQTRGVP